ncbi:hypothetical protein [Streptomyces noursei]|uniref:hypothetical protein n=1 Tax=Streptomyces noursei TaxID=1971 RepID=UPI0013009E0B
MLNPQVQELSITQVADFVAHLAHDELAESGAQVHALDAHPDHERTVLRAVQADSAVPLFAIGAVVETASL